MHACFVRVPNCTTTLALFGTWNFGVNKNLAVQKNYNYNYGFFKAVKRA